MSEAAILSSMEFNREKIEELKRLTLERIKRNREAATPAPASLDLESFSGLELKQGRMLPQEELRTLLQERHFVPLKSVTQTRPWQAQQDWVTVGVLVRRSEPRSAKNQSKYVVLVLSDLEGAEITVLLFSSAYEQWWREGLGSVMGLLNAEPIEGGKCFKVDAATKLLKIGEAQRYALCSGLVGMEHCSNYVNL